MANKIELGTQAEVIVLSATRMSSGEVRGIKLFYMFANDLSPVVDGMNNVGVAPADCWTEDMQLWSSLTVVPGRYIADMKMTMKKMKPTLSIEGLEYVEEVRLVNKADLQKDKQAQKV